MHALAYLQKRGHLSAVALGRKMFDDVADMTPARFDVLHILFDKVRLCRRPAGETRMYMRTIRKLLGLARQTVWKMVKRLVELGWLERRVCSVDRRQILLNLTAQGVARIKQAYTAAFSERYRVPPQPDGSPPTRRAYRKVQKDAKNDDWLARMFARDTKNFPRHVVSDLCTSTAPPRFGRDVTKVFKSVAKKRGRRRPPKRRLGTIGTLAAMTRDARALAQALGDTSTLIYPRLDFEEWASREDNARSRRTEDDLVVDPWTGAIVRRSRRRRRRSARRRRMTSTAAAGGAELQP